MTGNFYCFARLALIVNLSEFLLEYAPVIRYCYKSHTSGIQSFQHKPLTVCNSCLLILWLNAIIGSSLWVVVSPNPPLQISLPHSPPQMLVHWWFLQKGKGEC